MDTLLEFSFTGYHLYTFLLQPKKGRLRRKRNLPFVPQNNKKQQSMKYYSILRYDVQEPYYAYTFGISFNL